MAKGIIEAAINSAANSALFAYFFHGDKYIKYNWEKDSFESGYPAPLSKWNFPGKCANGIDAGFNGSGSSGGKAYFFKDDEYIRYDWEKNAVDNNYPKNLSLWNLPKDFANGIDAAVNGIGKSKEKVYFFKEDQYVRYDLADGAIDIGYPQPLSSWNLPGNFSSGIHAALDGRLTHDGIMYLFKDDLFIGYNWTPQESESLTPKDVSQWRLMFDADPLAPVDVSSIQPILGGNIIIDTNSI